MLVYSRCLSLLDLKHLMFSCIVCMVHFTYPSIMMLAVEVYPRPNGEIYICGIGGSDYIQKDDLKGGAFLTDCIANQARFKAAMASFQDMSSLYKQSGEVDRSQACMRPCPPDAMPYMGEIEGCEGAYINAGHNCC